MSEQQELPPTDQKTETKEPEFVPPPIDQRTLEMLAKGRAKREAKSEIADAIGSLVEELLEKHPAQEDAIMESLHGAAAKLLDAREVRKKKERVEEAARKRFADGSRSH